MFSKITDIKMAQLIINKGVVLIGITAMIILNSCYYDNVEELYPQPAACDTSNITFSGNVLPILEASCISCHSGGTPAGNVNLETYDDIVAAANNGSLMGTIRHESNWSPMPKNGAKLDNCTITKMEIWIADGTPNN